MPTLFRVGMGKLSTCMATQNSVAMPPQVPGAPGRTAAACRKI